ncbi:MAG: helix-turn-helix transcriptional regulator, partial [Nitrososphaerota archaeon]
MTNHTEPKTKTERIRELLREGLTPREVANKLGTSREYVYKEKGRMKRGGILVEHQSLSFMDGVKGITIVRDKENAGKFVDYQPGPIDRVNREFSEYDIPPLDTKGIMSMYDAFKDNVSPAEVIAKFGIHPDISQREHQRYLIMSSRDPFNLQNKIVGGIINAPPEIQAIIDKSKGNLLTND